MTSGGSSIARRCARIRKELTANDDTVSDFLLDRLAQLGRQAHLRLSGRRHQRHHRRARPRGKARSSSSRCATRRWPPSWRARTPSSPARSASAWRRPGPGAIHLLNGLYDAKLDHQPVVAIVGQQARAALGGDYQQEVDLHDALQGRRARVRADGDRRRRRSATSSIARCASRSPSAPSPAIIVPNDVQELDAVAAAAARARHGPLRRRLSRAARASRSDDDLRARGRRAERGREGRDAGRRGRAATPPTRSIEVADLLGAGVAKALLGKAVLPDDLPFVTGSIGLLGTKPSWDTDEGVRHAADGRLELPVLGVPARRRARRAACRSTSTAACSASAIRWR